MFISQVIFESDAANEAVLKGIMKSKLAGAGEVEGLASSECWKQDKGQRVAYTLVNRWEDREFFKKWMAAESHNQQHRDALAQTKGEQPDIAKTAYHFETMELADLG